MDGHRANTKGRWGGSGSASPPNTVRALVLHPRVGRDRGQAAAPGGRFGRRVLPRLGQRHLFPNWTPLLPPPTICHHASEPRRLLLHTPGSSAAPRTGTHRSCPTAGDSGPGLPHRPTLPPTVQQAQALQPCAPLKNTGCSAVPPLWPPTLPVPSLNLGLWSLSPAWMPQLLAVEGKRSCPGRPSPSLPLLRAGWAVRRPRPWEAKERGREEPETLGKFPSFRLPPKHPGRRGSLGRGSPFSTSLPTMPCEQPLKAQRVRMTTPKGKGVGVRHAPAHLGREDRSGGHRRPR